MSIPNKTAPIIIRIKEKNVTSTFWVLFESEARINKGKIKKTNIITRRNGINFPLPSLGTDPSYKILSVGIRKSVILTTTSTPLVELYI